MPPTPRPRSRRARLSAPAAAADGFRADCESQTGTRVSDCRSARLLRHRLRERELLRGPRRRHIPADGRPERRPAAEPRVRRRPLPEQSPDGVSMSRPLPVNTWTCAEFRADGSTGRLETWTGGTAVQGLAVDGSRVGC